MRPRARAVLLVAVVLALGAIAHLARPQEMTLVSYAALDEPGGHWLPAGHPTRPPDGRGPATPLPATAADLYMPGSQPGVLTDTLFTANDCKMCHSNYGQPGAEPFGTWAGSMMSQSARDPLFWAALAVANQDVAGAGTFCLRCHTPRAFLEGRAAPDGSQLDAVDFQGLTCHFCHRLVDPVFDAATSPARDHSILGALAEPVPFPGGGMYVVDPEDERRGPWRLQDEGWWVADCWPAEQCMNNNPHRPLPWPLESPFHEESRLCGTCHDVINPLLTGTPEEGYRLDPLGQRLDDLSTAFPVERTYTEWRLSDYATEAGVYAPQFNPALPDGIIHSCQDCHMPSAANASAAQERGWIPCRVGGASGPECPDQVTHDLVPVHDLTGANSWVPQMIKIHPEFGDDSTVLPAALDAGIERARAMLQKAATLSATRDGQTLQVRITNESGHKLPTGYAEGRQMWLSVTAYDASCRAIYRSGIYDEATGELHRDPDLRWFGVEQGLSEAWAAELGMAPGHSFHFLLNNEVVLDNRIPPRGFDNAAFAAAGAAPVGASYADGQYWADVSYPLPAGTAYAEVELRFQIASREYIEFLRDENHTNGDGDLLYSLWQQTGRSAPETLARARAGTPVNCLYLPLASRR